MSRLPTSTSHRLLNWALTMVIGLLLSSVGVFSWLAYGLRFTRTADPALLKSASKKALSKAENRTQAER